MKMRGLAACVLAAAAAAAWAADVKGEVSTEARVGFEAAAFTFNEENAALSFEQKVDDNLFVKVKLNVNYFFSPLGALSGSNLLSVGELGTASSVFPVEVLLDEAYFTYANFILEGIDLSVGKQRIPWGTADVLNPTDLLNPLDLSDPLDFGAKSPSVAVNLTYTPPDLDAFVQLVYEPYSQVALLNSAIIDALRGRLYRQVTASFVDGTTGWGAETAVTPAYDPKNFVFGAKIGGSLFGFDLSASYVTRMNDIPYVARVVLEANPGMPPLTLTSRSYELGYYREHEIGVDAAKDLGFVLAWAEAGVYFPEERTTVVQTYATGLPVLLDESSSVTVSGEPYVKYTVGASQRIGGIFYFNLQYNHGFFTERGNTGAERLQDYALLRLELSLLSDKLVFGATGLGNVNNLWDTFSAADPAAYIRDNYGVMGGLDVTYNPSLSTSLKAGVMVFEGTDTATIGMWRANDMLFVSFDVKF